MRLLHLTAAWVGGLLLGSLLHPPLWTILVPLFALLVIGLLIILSGRRSVGSWAGMQGWRPLGLFVAILLTALFLLGLLRSDASESSPAFVPDETQSSVRLNGTVAGPPESRGSALRFVLQARSIDRGHGWEDLTADVLVTARPTPELVSLRREPHLRYGDRLILEGSLVVPPILETF